MHQRRHVGPSYGVHPQRVKLGKRPLLPDLFYQTTAKLKCHLASVKVCPPCQPILLACKMAAPRAQHRLDTTVPEGEALDSAPNLGFLTVIHEISGYVGGYLVTNSWGRPLEFRLSTMVQPNRVQQILYGGTLKPYIYADLIGKTLVEKSGVAAQLVITDCGAALDLRLTWPTPMIWLAQAADASALELDQAGATVQRMASHLLLCHPKHAEDVATAGALLAAVGCSDLAEPFARIREALAEARKLGATHRAA